MNKSRLIAELHAIRNDANAVLPVNAGSMASVLRKIDTLIAQVRTSELVLHRSTITKEDALASIKRLRDAVNDTPDPTGWPNGVLTHLDRASDLLEFGEQRRSP